MRSLARNKQKIYYALYQSNGEVRDADGYLTGEPQLTYGNPVEYEINVSAARGTADVEQFGINENYTRTMVTNDMSCPIEESTRLWIGKDATVTVNEVTTVTPHNYVVIKKAPSINSITYAIKEVSVT